MKFNHPLIILFLFIFCVACSSKKEIKKFDNENPYAVLVTKERSFFQAEKIKNRLIDLKMEAYMVQFNDSSKNEGSWYYILAGSKVNIDSVKNYRKRIEEELGLKDLKIETYNNFKNAIFNSDSMAKTELKKITASKPDIQPDVYSVLEKFPENNAFFIQKSYVFNKPKNIENINSLSSILNMKIDLPRGITIKKMLLNTSTFTEIIYKDNLFGDQVTLDIAKLTTKSKTSASLLNVDNKALSTAAEYADIILNTGVYNFEEKTKIEIQSFRKLIGYKVTIEPEKDYFRKYLILIDEFEEFMIFCQSTDKTDEELITFLSNVGKGNGLLSYNEFYNTFFTIPANMPDEDRLIFFSLDKLGWDYANARGNTKWANEMVGHIAANGSVWNPQKGVWSFSLFDMLTFENQNYIYQDLYKGKLSKNQSLVKIGDVEGTYVTQDKVNWKTFKSYTKPSEVNLGIGRYIGAFANQESIWLTKEELIERAEAFQLIENDEIAVVQ